MIEELQNKTILITGATGLIGRNLICHIHEHEPSCRIVALVRSIEKARSIFSDNWLQYIEGDVCDSIVYEGAIDYIVHGASITSSKIFVEEPVDVILTNINGTRNLLELAKEKQVRSFVYLSTMEVYGAPTTDDKIAEDCFCNLDTMQKRSSYPESKRLCESMCTAYFSQYGVPAKVIRLTQTIGPGIDYYDGRVFAEFARCAVEKRDIVLHTKGETKRMYISADDAASAIITVLLKGINGEAYNAANENTYCSIYEMARMVAEEICYGKIKVSIETDDISKYGYLSEMKMNLDTCKLRMLGWKAIFSLKEMFENLISNIRIDNE